MKYNKTDLLNVLVIKYNIRNLIKPSTRWQQRQSRMIPFSKIPPTYGLSPYVAMTSVKTSVNRENVNLLLFFERQKASTCTDTHIHIFVVGYPYHTGKYMKHFLSVYLYVPGCYCVPVCACGVYYGRSIRVEGGKGGGGGYQSRITLNF